MQMCPVGNEAVRRPVGFTGNENENLEAKVKSKPLNIAITTLVLAIPLAASAQSPVPPQRKYCTALSKEYDRYVGDDHGATPLVVPDYGKEACKAHHAYQSIPVLERTLEDAKVCPPAGTAAVAQAAKTGRY